jgi:protein gp37
MGKSKIEWTDYTFNPWIGCAKVSEGCANCYAERENKRYQWNPNGWGPMAARKRTSERNWDQVWKWNRQQWWECQVCGARWAEGKEMDGACGHVAIDNYEAAEHTRARVFCASLADVFDGSPEVAAWRQDLFKMIHETPNLDWMLLTKRPESIKPMILDATGEWPDDWLQKNRHVWLGVSVENQAAAEIRIPYLLELPAAVKFVSCEPLLGPVNLRNLWPQDDRGERIDALSGWHCMPDWSDWQSGCGKLDWVICGGESGPVARPMHPAWVRGILDQCLEAEVPFFFKQWGEWMPVGQMPSVVMGWKRSMLHDYIKHVDDIVTVVRMGKKKTGRVLDGRTWEEMP